MEEGEEEEEEEEEGEEEDEEESAFVLDVSPFITIAPMSITVTG